MRIALDAMGGDYAPAAMVEGAVQAARETGVTVLLVGRRQAIEEELCRHQTRGLSLELVEASQVAGAAEAPSKVVRRKRDASIWVATRLVQQGHAEAVVSAGNTGATMAAALILLGRLRGAERPAIAATLPTLRGTAILLDVGANVDCRPQHLCQFAVMGACWAQDRLGKSRPTVGLLSIGQEDTKGNELTREVFRRLQASGLNFVGNVEGRDVYSGTTDVMVCDGFIGNIALKLSEGLAEVLSKLLKREIAAAPLGKAGYLLLRSAFGRFKKRIDYAEYGGAPLLGVNGVCVVGHGRSSPKAIKNAIHVAIEAASRRLNERIQRGLEVSL